MDLTVRVVARTHLACSLTRNEMFAVVSYNVSFILKYSYAN